MYIYHALINTLSVLMILINLNTIFYARVEHSSTKTIYVQCYMGEKKSKLAPPPPPFHHPSSPSFPCLTPLLCSCYILLATLVASDLVFKFYRAFTGSVSHLQQSSWLLQQYASLWYSICISAANIFIKNCAIVPKTNDFCHGSMHFVCISYELVRVCWCYS